MQRHMLRILQIGIVLGVLAPLWLYPEMSRANPERLFFVSTGHHLSDDFLGYWRASNGPQTLGAPISEPFADGDLTVQYFVLGRLERHPEYGNAIVRGLLGREYSRALARRFPAATSRADQADTRFFAATKHTLAPPFREFWEGNGGVEVFGFPISEPLWEYVGAELIQVQYFERTRLEYRAMNRPAVTMSGLGRDVARLRGINTAPVSPDGAIRVGDDGVTLIEPTPTPAPAPTSRPAATPRPTSKPVAPATSSSGKSIIVDISDQWLYAYAGQTLVYDAPVSTGRDGFNTPIGNFAVYAKLRSQTMEGTLGGEYYRVPDVPHVMYIVGGVAIHGTYWHNRFGTGVRMSHGCINVGLTQAAWLYNWAPMGTPVTVRW
ncbi:ErfK/YbiS/YcfS/YnhG family protein [Oscillochloris trichoides DG-6]|uniref:ErfK/YbiS/YcfS/YnhG family protein n=1 Tax=Oscillochloris trichoides DG-6 TaxID=765420 RepID=E1IDH1_9CHLR|nr:L,D-transpeptidase [Oscillochloris trichoides]EFO80751.1 ErfK/YbiS/YcfS/YnhG family protein [Oscillochloris trichoides DG-6]